MSKLKFSAASLMAPSLATELRVLERQLDHMVDDPSWNTVLHLPEGKKCWEDLQVLVTSVYKLQQADLQQASK